MTSCSEQSIASARASVMIYDDINKKWVPSGSSSGLSKVHIFQHQVNNTFRVVGRKLQNQEVVINCVILKSLKYNQATATFHQWRDNKQVYGLNFSSKEDADTFARAMVYAVEVLASAPRPAIQQFPSPPVYPQTNGQYEEDMGYRPIVPMQQVSPAVQPNAILYPDHNQHQVNNNQQQEIPVRTMTREDVAVLQERRMSQQSQMSSPSAVSPPSQVPGHHRTSSAPPAPQPPPLSVATPPAPPPAPALPSNGPPCPPPPPLPNSGASTFPRSSSSDLMQQQPVALMDMGSLAAQLQSARLKRANKQSAENSGSSTTSSSSGGGSNYGTLGRGNTGMASMMDEMAKTLARRRAAVEKKETPESNNAQEPDTSSTERRAGSVGSVNWNNKSAANGWESPKTSRKNLGASSEELVGKVNGETGAHQLTADLETFKQEILREMRKEFAKMKTEIIEAIKIELNKR